MIETKPFVDDTAGFQIGVPRDWLVAQDFAGAALVIAEPVADGSDFATNVNVVVQEDEAHAGVALLMERAVDLMTTSLSDFRLIDREEPTGSEPGRLVAAYRQGVHTLTLDQSYVMAGTRCFVVTGTVRAEDLEEQGGLVRELIETFEPRRA